MITPRKNLKKFRVLVGTPYNEVKEYCFDEFLQRATNLSYKHYDFLIADNSKSNKIYKSIIKSGIESVHIKPKNKVNQKFILESHEALRRAAIKGGYDYLLHLESDIIPPHDIIERLIVHQKPIVSAAYFISQGEDSHLMLQEIESDGQLRETRNVQNGYDIMQVDGKLKQVYAAGLGCILIHKSILKKFQFRWQEGAPVHPDTFFAHDLHSLETPQFIDTSIICEHRNSNWLEIKNVVR